MCVRNPILHTSYLQNKPLWLMLFNLPCDTMKNRYRTQPMQYERRSII
ncbi:hypothetical protein CBFG_02057 [Clostridiales bacterium 1_7_47FAA]|nr:hypothetical protein CBFG_02057 [Clostridiales bacterium 1_7_47FAA]